MSPMNPAGYKQPPPYDANYYGVPHPPHPQIMQPTPVMQPTPPVMQQVQKIQHMVYANLFLV